MKPEEQLHPHNSLKLIGKKFGRKFEIKRKLDSQLLFKDI